MPHALTAAEFEALLALLGPDRERAGRRYEELRRRLVTIFLYRRCVNPEELADATLDRAARKLFEMACNFQGSDPGAFIYAVAWRIAKESLRQQRLEALPDDFDLAAASPATDEEMAIERQCLERCLGSLPKGERTLLLKYHQEEKRSRIRLRSIIARHFALSPNALRLRIHRITLRLRDCVFRCVDMQCA